MENSKLLTILVEVNEGTKTPFKAHNEILSLFGVVKSLKEKRKLHFGEWKQSKGFRYMSGHTYKDSDGDLYDADEVDKMYQTYYDSF